MAAHGHLDALHISIWLRGYAVIIDPGTGCYYHDAKLRNYLASWEAHNGPRHAADEDDARPLRHGPFLWADRHPDPELVLDGQSVGARFRRSLGTVSRTIQKTDHGWTITDRSLLAEPIRSNWQIAPEWDVKKISARALKLDRGDLSIIMNVCEGTNLTLLDCPSDEHHGGICSQGFRSACFGARVDLISAQDASRSETTVWFEHADQ